MMSETLPFFLLAFIGAHLLLISLDVTLAYLSMELMTMAFVALVVLNRHSHAANEAAIKYLFLSALASSFLLMGTS
jgi:NADH-quinone oxidoreductase subunit N